MSKEEETEFELFTLIKKSKKYINELKDYIKLDLVKSRYNDDILKRLNLRLSLLYSICNSDNVTFVDLNNKLKDLKTFFNSNFKSIDELKNQLIKSDIDTPINDDKIKNLDNVIKHDLDEYKKKSNLLKLDNLDEDEETEEET